MSVEVALFDASGSVVTVQPNGNMVAQQPRELSLSEMIFALARDPDVVVEKVQAILAMKRDLEAHEAKVKFGNAMRQAQKEMPRVVRLRKNKDTGSTFAALEDIDPIIRPIYEKYGFTLTWNSQSTTTDLVRVTCKCMHEGGHTENYELEGPRDTTGPKGTQNKTGIQGTVSTASYLRRNLECFIWNVVTRGQDRDGNAAPATLTDDQWRLLKATVEKCELSPAALEKMLSIVNVNTLAEVRENNYGIFMNMLKAKLDQKGIR
jgi:hypothetical protein